ncbi:unnamed protein product [Dibothriocephalus latus]|uniref:Uncharacterized protein n=1 Tax=Dibothriocephalus latus TaxID=60516 RepID=A0A3P7L2Y4_DIBLA|nr:unnamed protein product [Dibothriocephalus latus]
MNTVVYVSHEVEEAKGGCFAIRTESRLQLNNWTSLHWAAQRGHVDVVCALLKGGANRRAKDAHGNMPYMVTQHAELAAALRPDAYYPEILSNGFVSTDEEDGEASSRSSEAGTPFPQRRTKASPSPHAQLATDEISAQA